MFTSAVCTEPIEATSGYIEFKHIKSIYLWEIARTVFLSTKMHSYA